MLVDSSRLINCPVLSLHIGGEIARTVEPIINPNGLRIVGYVVDGPLIENENILQIRDIREYSKMGIIIDSIDELVNSDDIVRLKEIAQIRFKIIGHRVVTKKGTKLGKVVGYTINVDTFEIQQLIVQPSIIKAFIGSELLIGRSEIMEVDDNTVVVRDEENKIREKSLKEDFVPNFVNPFRNREAVGMYTDDYDSKSSD